MIRTSEELVDRIAGELTWRRKELTDIKGLIGGATGSLRSRVLVKAGVAMLYAHWEGFVKVSASNYLEYVASCRVPYADLRPNFIALALRSQFDAVDDSNRISRANEIADFFCGDMSRRSNIPFKKVIETKSNLSSAVLTDILAALGLSASDFSTKATFIDRNLVQRRNFVAHGEDIDLTAAEYFELHDAVVVLIESFRNLVENAAVMQVFRRTSPDQA